MEPAERNHPTLLGSFLEQLFDCFEQGGRRWSGRGEVLRAFHDRHEAHWWFSPQTVERGEGRRFRVASLPSRRTKVAEIDKPEMDAIHFVLDRVRAPQPPIIG
jgi:hypothetical protein